MKGQKWKHSARRCMKTCRDQRHAAWQAAAWKGPPQIDPIKGPSPLIGASFPRLGWETQCALKQKPGLEKQEINEPDIHITKVLPSDSQSSQRTNVGLTKLISWTFQAGTTSSLLRDCILDTPREEEIKLHKQDVQISKQLFSESTLLTMLDQ